MKRLHPSSQFKKDLKRYRHRQAKLAALERVLDLLINGEPLPKQYLCHRLSGNYEDCLECHIESDFLLIWIDDNDVVELIRLGSHSELFNK